MAWKAFLIEAVADVGTLSEAVPETVRGIGVMGQAARRVGRRSRRRRVRIDWLKPARLGLQRMVQGNWMLVSFLLLVGMGLRGLRLCPVEAPAHVGHSQARGRMPDRDALHRERPGLARLYRRRVHSVQLKGMGLAQTAARSLKLMAMKLGM